MLYNMVACHWLCSRQKKHTGEPNIKQPFTSGLGLGSLLLFFVQRLANPLRPALVRNPPGSCQLLQTARQKTKRKNGQEKRKNGKRSNMGQSTQKRRFPNINQPRKDQQKPSKAHQPTSVGFLTSRSPPFSKKKKNEAPSRRVARVSAPRVSAESPRTANRLLQVPHAVLLRGQALPDPRLRRFVWGRRFSWDAGTSSK